MAVIDFIRVTQTGNYLWDFVWVVGGEHFRCSPVVFAAGSEDHLNISSKDAIKLRRVSQCRGKPCEVTEVDPGLIMALDRGMRFHAVKYLKPSTL